MKKLNHFQENRILDIKSIIPAIILLGAINVQGMGIRHHVVSWPNIPELRDRICSEAHYQFAHEICWVNRDSVLSSDGSTLNYEGLGYGVGGNFQPGPDDPPGEPIYDDVDAFKIKLQNEYRQGVKWSQYPCANLYSWKGQYRPGYRVYCLQSCRMIGGGDICSPQDLGVGRWQNWPNTASCTWKWTGALCYHMVIFSLKYSDPNRFSQIMDNWDIATFFKEITNLGLAQEVPRRNAVRGDLIFIDMNSYDDDNGWSPDHVGIYLIHAGGYGNEEYWYNDDLIGIIGYYSEPFRYKASRALIIEHQKARDNDWKNGNRPIFGPILRQSVKYVHLTGE